MNSWGVISILAGSVIGTGVLTMLFGDFFGKIKQYVTTIGVSFVLGLICLHVLPELFGNGNAQTGLYLLIGFVIQIFLELFSRGIEHGHIHNDEHDHQHGHEHNHEQSFTINVLLSVFLGLCVHAFIEGIPLFILEDLGHHGHEHHGHVHHQAEFSWIFFWAVLSHKLPVAIVLMLFLLSGNLKKGTAFLLFTVFAFMTPLGGILGSFLQEKAWFESLSLNLLAVTTGMLLHITTLLIFEEYHDKKDKAKNLLLIIAGLALSFVLFN